MGSEGGRVTAGAGIDAKRAWALAAVLAASSLLFIVLVHHLPVSILAGAGHDDAWFWQRAGNIAAGQWLGAFDQMTLIKGPGYPLFLAASHALGLPGTTMQAVLHCLACLLLGVAVHRMCGRPLLSTLLVVALQWQPAALGWNRVIRDNIGGAQVILALACLLLFMYAPRRGRRGLRWAVLAGLACGWLWSTREDAVWVVPGFALLLLAHVATGWRSAGERRRTGIGIALVGLGFAAWLSLVAGINLASYGVFTTVDTRASAYRDALSALHRVRVGPPVPYVPVPGPVREAVYGASPSFARLRSYLEDPARRGGDACRQAPEACIDYSGGRFLWVLRAAAASVGEYRSAPAADAYFRQVADEIGAACEVGTLACTSPLVASIPPVDQAQWRTVPARIGKAAALLAWQGVGGGQPPSDTAVGHAGAMWRFVGEPPVRDPPGTLGVRVGGWFHGAPTEWLVLRCAAPDARVAVERRPSPDVARHFQDPGAGMNRFDLAAPAIEGCAFQSTAGPGEVPLTSFAAAPASSRLGSGTLNIDAMSTGIPLAAREEAWPRAARHVVWEIHGRILPWLAAAGLLAFAWNMLRAAGRLWLSPLQALAASAWCLVAARVGLLVLVDMSAFAAIRIDYLQPAFPLLLLAAIASLAALGDGRPQQQRNPPRPP